MRCPVCVESQLVMTERQGIEIDYCPQCRGVWLDRGELDKIIERATPVPMPQGGISQGTASISEARPPVQPQMQPPAPIWNQAQPTRDDDDYRRRRDYDDDDDDRRYKKKKRSGLLGDLFDFD